MRVNPNWFKDWFDTPFYHELYEHRNDAEAELFMRNLVVLLQLNKNQKVLDLPCGRGRHAVYLNSLDLNVIGADLSKNNIDYASQFENETLKFVQRDMRKPLKNKYDAIFNLFTSFGYFENDEENINVLSNFKSALENEGHLIIDFLNIHKTKNQLIPEEIISKKNTEYHIKRMIENGFINKSISFEFEGYEYNFNERVKSYDLNDFKELTHQSGLKIDKVFGDYHLNDFNENHSDRLILMLS